MIDTELYSPNLTKSEVKEGYIYIEEAGFRKIYYNEYDDLAIFEGDIVLCSIDTMNEMNKLFAESKIIDNDQNAIANMVIKACAINSIGKRWPNAIIPYEISPELSSNKAIKDAISFYNTKTEIHFVARGASDKNYVRFVHSDGCSSYVGMIGGKQEIRIADWAGAGAVMHEMCHAAAMWHEQSRADRNHYVDIHLDNLSDSSMAHNFDQHINDGMDLDVYDYSSLMNYSSTAFAKFGKKTIVPKDSKASIGQRNELSLRDKLGLQSLYLYQNLDPITDLKVISGDNPDISAPEGFTKLYQDTNQGARGKYIYICYKKGSRSSSSDQITDMIVIAGNSSSIAPPAGYTKIQQDLSQCAGGKYTYLCYKRGGTVAITNISLLSGNSSDIMNEPGYGFSVIPQDLNEGAGGKYIYLCYQNDPLTPIEDITVISGDSNKISPPAGYTRVNVDLNKGAGGKYIYLCYKRGNANISDITLIAGDSANINAPAGFTKINQDLNQGASGKYIYVCIKKGSSRSIKNVGAIYGNFYDIQPPTGWIKINQDANQGAGGDYIFICYKP